MWQKMDEGFEIFVWTVYQSWLIVAWASILLFILLNLGITYKWASCKIIIRYYELSDFCSLVNFELSILAFKLLVFRLDLMLRQQTATFNVFTYILYMFTYIFTYICKLKIMSLKQIRRNPKNYILWVLILMLLGFCCEIVYLAQMGFWKILSVLYCDSWPLLETFTILQTKKYIIIWEQLNKMRGNV